MKLTNSCPTGGIEVREPHMIKSTISAIVLDVYMIPTKPLVSVRRGVDLLEGGVLRVIPDNNQIEETKTLQVPGG